MAPPYKFKNYLILALLAILSQQQQQQQVAAAGDPKVNLINPTFISSEVTSCKGLNYTGIEDDKQVVCSLYLWTRAAQYQINDIITARTPTSSQYNVTHPQMTRIGQWARADPGPLKDEQGFFYGNYTKTTGQDLVDQFDRYLKRENVPNSRYHIMNNTALYPYVRCEAKVYKKQSDTFYCARDNRIAKCTKDKSCIFSVELRDVKFPVSALAVEETADGSIDFLFDFSSNGYLRVYEVREISGTSLKMELKTIYMLSALGSELDSILVRPNAIHANETILKSHKGIKKKAMTRMAERLEYTYPTAVWPVGQGYTADTYNKPIQRICLSTGLHAEKHAEDICSTKSSGFNHSIEPPSPGKYPWHEVHAFSQVEQDGLLVQNIFITLHDLGANAKSTQSKSYIFRKKRINTNNNNNGTKPLVYNWRADFDKLSKQQRTTNRKDRQATGDDVSFKIDDIEVVPNDVVPFFDPANKCTKQIVFYSVVYQVFDFDKPLHYANSIHYEPRFNFYIHAAFSHDGKFYFFSGANTLLIVPAKMDGPTCQSVVFDLAATEETTGLAYYGKTLDWNLDPPFPSLTDYTELAEGDTDTNPALNPDSDDDGDGDPKRKKGSSNIIIISIAFVIGGLILAGIIYVCFIMSGSAPPAANGERRPRAKSRRAKPSEVEAGAAKSSQDAVNPIKTLRSHMPSAIGSKIKSPGQRPKSKRAFGKSRGKSKKSKLSGGVRKSPTSLTTVKVSHGEPIPVHRDQVPSTATATTTTPSSHASSTAASSAASSTASGATKSPSATAQKSTSSAGKAITPRSPRSATAHGSTDGNVTKSPKSPNKSRASSSATKSPKKQ